MISLMPPRRLFFDAARDAADYDDDADVYRRLFRRQIFFCLFSPPRCRLRRHALMPLRLQLPPPRCYGRYFY